MKKPILEPPSNDAIRGDILNSLYDAHRKSRSPKSAAVALNKLAASLKASKGYKLQAVSSNLDYLVQKSWAAVVKEPRTWTSPAGTQQSSEKITYKISAIGIDKLEGGSLYKAPPIGGTMNITTINGVTVVGDGNVVNTSFGEASKALKQLRDEISLDDKIPDEQKLSTISDIDSISTQLQKPTPNASVISTLWRAIEVGVVSGHAVELAHKAAHFLAPLLT